MEAKISPLLNLVASYDLHTKLLEGTGEKGLDFLDEIWKKIEAYEQQFPSKIPKKVRILERTLNDREIQAILFVVKRAFGDSTDFVHMTLEEALGRIDSPLPSPESRFEELLSEYHKYIRLMEGTGEIGQKFIKLLLKNLQDFAKTHPEFASKVPKERILKDNGEKGKVEFIAKVFQLVSKDDLDLIKKEDLIGLFQQVQK